MDVSEPQIIIGFGGQFHDSNVAFAASNGDLLFVMEEERLSRVRHHMGPPNLAIAEASSVWETAHSAFGVAPFDELQGLPIDTYYCGGTGEDSRSRSTLPRGIFKDGRWYDHHFAHCCYARLFLPHETILAISIDALGSDQCASAYLFNGCEFNRIASVGKENSLGLLWENACEICGLHVENTGRQFQGRPGVLAGLAGAGIPRYLEFLMSKCMDLGLNGWCLHDQYSFDWESEVPIRPNLLNDWLSIPPTSGEHQLMNIHADLAASIQVFTERVVSRWLNHLLVGFRPDIVAFTGGLALNPRLNQVLLHQCSSCGIGFWVPAAPSDAGGSISSLAAYFVERNIFKFGGIENYPFIGCSYSPEDVFTAADAVSLPAVNWGSQASEIAVDRIVSQGVVAWCAGRSEHGPRALGARSLLADPRSRSVASLVNQLKGRSWFRPVAPMVLSEHWSRWFSQKTSPYMNIAAKATMEAWRDIPAAIHIDGTARVQIVPPGPCPARPLLNSWHRKTGVPVLLNTSFNRGEPIVETPADAIRNAMAMGLDTLFFEGVEITLKRRDL